MARYNATKINITDIILTECKNTRSLGLFKNKREYEDKYKTKAIKNMKTKSSLKDKHLPLLTTFKNNKNINVKKNITLKLISNSFPAGRVAKDMIKITVSSLICLSNPPPFFLPINNIFT